MEKEEGMRRVSSYPLLKWCFLRRMMGEREREREREREKIIDNQEVTEGR